MLRSFVSVHITLRSCLMPHHIIVPIASYYLALPEVITATAATNRKALSITTVTGTLDETSQTTVPAIQNHRRGTRPLCAGLKFSQAKVRQGNYFIDSICYCLKVETFSWGALPNCNGCHLPLLSNNCIFSCLFLLAIDSEGVLRQLKFLEQL